jgi:hypothetical protein
MLTDEDLAVGWARNDLLADTDLADDWVYAEPLTDEYLAVCWAHEIRLTTVYRLTWQDPQFGVIQRQRFVGQDAAVAKVDSVQPRWFTVDEWRGHETRWVRLSTMVRNRAGRYKRLRVN